MGNKIRCRDSKLCFLSPRISWQCFKAFGIRTISNCANSFSGPLLADFWALENSHYSLARAAKLQSWRECSHPNAKYAPWDTIIRSAFLCSCELACIVSNQTFLKALWRADVNTRWHFSMRREAFKMGLTPLLRLGNTACCLTTNLCFFQSTLLSASTHCGVFFFL
jgi:hypothetical protein